MPNYLKPSKRVTVVSYARSFDYADEPGAGFSFPCDEQGHVHGTDGKPLNRGAKANYAACQRGAVDGHKVIDRGIVRREHSHIEPAVIACVDCRRQVTLTHDAVRCKCGRYYNLSGQALSDPSAWGEETGESAADILGPRRR
jgi:hypothetical protein